ncbi:hydroxymethylpyrimidine pyrophosphatase-like HAD family hydrolase [Desulfohalotomaculum tongense]|uniref:HAD family hydrolase n=1 Tax=Desulforadius tongensis TaxID=1216062 RepID=UPI001957DAB7|nr:HAD family hydrolase [Desulforadius tongensis]MBM7855522.1 hydroxymethylpyrimidine pyrophosphatase-like HAD family hydrolase [Desulforadius tongensis]
MIKLIALDVDGCLMPHDLTKVDYQAFTRLREYCLQCSEKNLPKICLCTGRPRSFVLPLLALLGALWPDIPSVLESGNQLYFPLDRRITVNPLVPDSWPDIKRAVKDFAQKTNGLIIPGKEVAVSLIPPRGISIEKYSDMAKDSLPYQELDISYSTLCVDFNPRGINKKVGLETAAGMLDIPLSQVLAIGDSGIDMEMLNSTGYTACPANAIDEVKKVCQYVSPYRETRGVVDIIENLIKGAGLQ